MRQVIWCIIFFMIGCIIGWNNNENIGFWLSNHNEHTYMVSARNVVIRGDIDAYNYMQCVLLNKEYNSVELLPYSLIMKYQYGEFNIVGNDIEKILKMTHFKCNIDSIYKTEIK